MRITTNNVPRDVIYDHELTEEERKEFEYINGKDEGEFFRYKGETYDLGEFSTTAVLSVEEFQKWDGYMSETYFSGILISWIGENFEQVIVGRYCT